MLERGSEEWYEPVTPVEVAPYFHKFLTEKPYRKRIDFSSKNTKALWEYDEKKVAKLVADMPMTKWSGNSKGLVEFDGERFSLAFEVAEDDAVILFEMTKEICEFRLHSYFERKDHK